MFQMPRKATTLFCMVLGQIDLGQILVTALVSAVVSFAVTVILRVWDRRTVEWLVPRTSPVRKKTWCLISSCGTPVMPMRMT